MALIGRNISINRKGYYIGTLPQSSTSNLSTNYVAVQASDASNQNLSPVFGDVIAIGDNKIVVSAPGNEHNSLVNPGNLYILDYSGNEVGIITRTSPRTNDLLGGHGLCIHQNKIIANTGTYTDDGVNGNAPDEVYIFSKDEFSDSWNETKLTGHTPNNSDYFGLDIDAGYGIIAVSAMRETVNSYDGAGAVHLYDMQGNHTGIITASNPGSYTNGFNYTNVLGEHMLFGRNIKIASGYIFISSWITVDTTGNGQVDNYAGEVHVHDLSGSLVGIITSPDGSGGQGNNGTFGDRISVGHGRIAIQEKNRSTTSNTSRVHLFDLDFNHVGTMTTSIAPVGGRTSSSFRFGDAIVIGDNRIFISDPGEYQGSISYVDVGVIYEFDMDGNEIGTRYPNESYVGGDIYGYYGLNMAIGDGVFVASRLRDSPHNNSGEVRIFNVLNPNEYSLDLLTSNNNSSGPG